MLGLQPKDWDPPQDPTSITLHMEAQELRTPTNLSERNPGSLSLQESCGHESCGSQPHLGRDNAASW